MNRLVLVCLLAGLTSALGAQVSPAPGSYDSPVALSATVPDGGTVKYRFLESSSTAWTPWSGALTLEALPGETRHYGLRVVTESRTGESQTKDFLYQVSGKVDAIASVQPEPGTYSAGITIRPQLPSGWKVLENGRVVTFPRTLDAQPGKVETSTIEASGPRGARLVWNYVVDRRDQEVVALDLLSPVEGEWANAQTLVASFRGVDRVVWSYGGQVDPLSAREYLGPVLLDRPGVQTITVAARSRVDGRWIERQVRWGNGASAGPSEDWPSSGALSTSLRLPALPSGTLSWDEGRSWLNATEAVTEDLSLTSRKILTVQVQQSASRYRSVYWLDARVPESPRVEFVGGWNPRLQFSGSLEAVHRVVWTLADGRAIEAAEQLWGPTGSWKVPDQVVAARVEAVAINRRVSPAVSVGFAETGWSTPLWEPWDQTGPLASASVLPLGGRVLPRQGFWPVYEVSDRPDVAEPNANSPLLDGAFVPNFPLGSDRTLYARFAWRDAGGLVGPGSPAVAVRSDRIPPPAPEVLTAGGQVMVRAAEGEEEGGTLLWAVTPERVASDEALSFQVYQNVLDTAGLRTGSSGALWFHARAVDRAGNSGPPRLNVALPPAADTGAALVQVDTDPGVGDFPVENGGVYPWSSFRLRALDQSRDLWVGVSDAAGVPADWRTKLQPWKGLLSRGVARGERRTFVVYWNAKNAEGWVWPQPQSVSLTLDLSAPAMPVASGTWPTAPLGGPWTLVLTPGRTGDRLQYTQSLDGSLPPDPLAEGQPWPGTLTWDAPPLSRLTVRIRVAAVSVSGLRLEAPLGDTVVLDRSVPAAVSPALEPFTYRTEPLTVAHPKTADGGIRYTVTTDGRLPDVPGSGSPLVPSRGLYFEGKDGQSVLYRLRWRSFSAAGIPGPSTDAFGILVDRTLSSRSAAVPATGGKVANPRILGLPSGGLSSAPVTLTVDGPAGFLHYELREGVGTPRTVAPDSPVWPGTLVLDSGEGVDRSFALTVRAFSPDGRPLTDEVTGLLRIDRSLPLGPTLSLTADSRRPEAMLQGQSSTGSPEETLHYRWLWDAFGVGKGTAPWATLASQPAVFSAPNGALTRLTVQAYLTDEAGNVGPSVEQSLLIDQNVVYLSAKATGTGSRNSPLGSLQSAVERARLQGKSVLFVASGTYPASETVDLSGLVVYGGLSPSLWETTTDLGRSSWVATAPFQGRAFVVSGPAAWSLSAVDLATASVDLDAVVSVKGAAVTVTNATWSWAGATRGWQQDQGSLDWTNVSLTSALRPQGTLLDWKGVEAQVRTLRLSATGNQGGQVVALEDCTALFQDLVLVSKRASGFDGLWSNVRSTLTMDQARVQAGDGAERATAFVIKDSDASFWNTEISLYAASSNTGFQVSGGRLEVQKTSLALLLGKEFNQGLVLDQVDSRLRTLDLKVESGAYQGAFSIDGGNFVLGSSKVKLAGGGNQVWGGQFLSPVAVTLQDVSWVLATKTSGDLWKRLAEWKPGSTVAGSTTVGW